MTTERASRRRLGRRAVVTLGLATALAGVGVATGTASAGTLPQTVQVTVGGGRTQISTHDVSAGWTTFDVASLSKPGHDGLAQVFRLRPGVTLAKLTADLTASGTDNGPFTTAVSDDAVLYGGIDVLSGQSGTFADYLNPGTYYVINVSYKSSSIATDAERLTVHAPVRHGAVPATQGTILMQHMRFYPSAHLPAAGTVVLTNSAKDAKDDIHFLVLLPVKPGTTDKEIQAYFDDPTGPPAFITAGPSANTGVISPGESMDFSYDLPAGTYAMFCFITDPQTGMEHAAMGMHKVVHLG